MRSDLDVLPADLAPPCPNCRSGSRQQTRGEKLIKLSSMRSGMLLYEKCGRGDGGGGR